VGRSLVLYRTVDKVGATIDFLLTAKQDRKAALRFLRKAIEWNGTPAKITIDKSGANTAAIESHNDEHEAGIEIRQVKYLNTQAAGAANARVQILQVSRRDACRY
jgi:putative transposase